MAYRQDRRNCHILIGTKDTQELGLKLLWEIECDPPEPKLSLIEVPGGDGYIDATSVDGDVRYGPRQLKFQVLAKSPEAYEGAVAYLHGRTYPFQLSWDVGYTYEDGRFVISGYDWHTGLFDLDVTCQPWRYGGKRTWKVNGAGGVTLNLPSGRRPTCPVIEVDAPTLVGYEGNSWTIFPGANKITDLWLKDGNNALYINTRPSYDVSTLSIWETAQLSSIATKLLSDLCQADGPLQETLVLSKIELYTLNRLASMRLIELSHPPDPDAPQDTVYIQFERWDL